MTESKKVVDKTEEEQRKIKEAEERGYIRGLQEANRKKKEGAPPYKRGTPA